MMKIVTHDGPFHADDVFACATLRLLYPEASIVRTRDAGVIRAADIVVDVGGRYIPLEGRFDHHQWGEGDVPPKGKRSNGVRYSSFGLVWKNYASSVVKRWLEGGFSVNDIDDVSNIVDLTLVQTIDASDNGQALMSRNERYGDVSSYSISQMIHSINPSWYEVTREVPGWLDALEVADLILRRAMQRAYGEVRARAIVRQAVYEAADADRQVVILDEYVPWQGVIHHLGEADMLYIVFPGANDDWMCQCIPDKEGSFGKRKALPAVWATLRGEDFVEATQVVDAIFCHGGRFICGAESREGALSLAALAVAY